LKKLISNQNIKYFCFQGKHPLGKVLIENIRADIMRSAILYPDLKIIWSDILPRRYWHYGDNHGAIEGTRKRVNIPTHVWDL
jgi:hypothetical protein